MGPAYNNLYVSWSLEDVSQAIGWDRSGIYGTGDSTHCSPDLFSSHFNRLALQSGPCTFRGPNIHLEVEESTLSVGKASQGIVPISGHTTPPPCFAQAAYF